MNVRFENKVGESDFMLHLLPGEAPDTDLQSYIDYQKLNSLTRTECFQLPNTEKRVEVTASTQLITLI